MDAGALVRARRVAHGVSQRSLAIRADVDQATIERVESGEQDPSIELVERLLLCLGERLELSAVALEPRGAEPGMAAGMADGTAWSDLVSQTLGQARG